MRLGIISDCLHFETPTGEVATENHILLKQFEALATHFESVIICCPFISFNERLTYSIYQSSKISFIKVKNVGGNNVLDKVRIIANIPSWINAFKKVNASSDIVYQRFPNNINIPGLLYFYAIKKPVFATYTGSWDSKNEPFTYRLQKKWLKKYFRGPVWVYSKKIQSGKFRNGISPSYNSSVWEEEDLQVKARIKSIEQNGISCLKLVSVGSLVTNKNHKYILDACKLAKQKGITFQLIIVGDGPLKRHYLNFIAENGLEQDVHFVGKKDHAELRNIYRKSDFILQSPIKEGFGKVPIEGFFHGLTPIISNTEMASYITQNQEQGFVFNTDDDPSVVVNIFSKILDNPAAVITMINMGRSFAKAHTLESWAFEYYKGIEEYFG